MPLLLFVTAKLPLDRINTFLSEHQSLPDIIAPNSMVSLVRDHTTSVADLKEVTEPSVDEFESGFINANDEDLWQSLHRLAKEDDGRPGAGTLDRDMLFALDETSKANGKCRPPTCSILPPDTVAILWRRSRSNGELYKFRVVFRFVPLVIADLLEGHRDEVDEVYVRSDVKDEDGTLDMKKVKEALGVPWRYS